MKRRIEEDDEEDEEVEEIKKQKKDHPSCVVACVMPACVCV